MPDDATTGDPPEPPGRGRRARAPIRTRGRAPARGRLRRLRGGDAGGRARAVAAARGRRRLAGGRPAGLDAWAPYWALERLIAGGRGSVPTSCGSSRRSGTRRRAWTASSSTATRRPPRSRPSWRRRGMPGPASCRPSSTRSSRVRWRRFWPIRRSGRGTSRRWPISRPAATSQGWTSTTSSSPSPTTARPGSPPVRAGWRSSRSWPNGSTPTVARSPSASRPCTTPAGRPTAATGSTTTRPSPRWSTASG